MFQYCGSSHPFDSPELALLYGELLELGLLSLLFDPSDSKAFLVLVQQSGESSKHRFSTEPVSLM